LIALSKLVGIFGPFFRPSKVADVDEKLTKLLAKSSKSFASYLMSRPSVRSSPPPQAVS